MAIYTDEERYQAFAEMAGKAVDDSDLDYFRTKLIRALERKAPAASMEKVFKQLALMEDALVIYHEHRLPESE